MLFASGGKVAGGAVITQRCGWNRKDEIAAEDAQGRIDHENTQSPEKKLKKDHGRLAGVSPMAVFEYENHGKSLIGSSDWRVVVRRHYGQFG